MRESYLFDATFNNVIFATRNKAYGAYQLRRIYNKHVVTATVIAIATFGLSLASPLLLPDNVVAEVTTGDDQKKPKTVILDLPLLPPPVETKEQASKPVAPVEQKVKTVRNPIPKIVPDSHVGPDEVPPTQQAMTNAIIGTQNIDGEPRTAVDFLGIDGGTNSAGSGTAGEGSSSVFDFAEEMPTFEGGDAALLKYIGKRMRYPRQAVDEKIEGTVIVTFVVNKAGKVTDVTVLKGLGFGTDEEASRVIENMPAWNPGKQNGMPVAVRYTLPIRFSLQR
jgi:periplasmic protein TonB